MDNNRDSRKPIITNQFPKQNSNLSIASLVLGIITLAAFWVPILPIITGLTGLATGVINLIEKRNGSTMAIIGIVLSSIGLLLGIISFIIFLLSLSQDNNNFYIIGQLLNFL